MTVARADVAVGHLDDAASVEEVLAALRQLHDERYEFAMERWDGERRIEAMPGTVVHLFVVTAENAHIRLYPGEQVRGPSAEGPYRRAGEMGELIKTYTSGSILKFKVKDAPLNLQLIPNVERIKAEKL